MNCNTGLKIACYIGFTILPVILIPLVKRKYKQKEEKLNQKNKDDSDYDFIFVTYNNNTCRQHVYDKQACSPKCSYAYLKKIIQFLDSAKHTISVCAYLLTSIEISDALIRAVQRGVVVRFICDNEMIGASGSKAHKLRNAGVKVKTQPRNGTIMHHKYCLVDEIHVKRRRLFFGTLNLTLQALTSNWDHIIFTNNPAMVQRYSEEFESLWKEFHFL